MRAGARRPGPPQGREAGAGAGPRRAQRAALIYINGSIRQCDAWRGAQCRTDLRQPGGHGVGPGLVQLAGLAGLVREADHRDTGELSGDDIGRGVGNLRWGELAGLRRRNLDLGNRTVRVVETVYELDRLVKGTPKSEASTRKVTLPELIIPELRRHLEAFTPPGPEAFVFVHVKGGQLRRSNFTKPWARALGEAGLPAGVHVHDLRHTGNTLTAEAGASLAELMTRMGHSSTRAAKVYLHAREERDRQLADVLDRMARRELKRSGTARNVSRSGTYRARGRSSGPKESTDGHG